MKKGFTLDELSIVLVIIGLLIGGILAAQSMIGTSKTQALVRQIGQFDAAVENFQTKYQQLPGDSNLMGATPGNNDGVITSQPGEVCSCNAYYYGEIAQFWADLSKSGLTRSDGGSYVDPGTTQIFPNPTIAPRALAGSNASIYGVGSPISKNNYYLVTQNLDTTHLFSVYGLTGPLQISDVLAIDKKMDDGVANAGNVQGWGGTNMQNNGSTTDHLETPDGNGNCATASAYNVTASYTCGVRIRMGTSTGNIK